MDEYMLDTNVVGEIDAGNVDARVLYNSPNPFYITHVQKGELEDAGWYSKFLLKVLEIVDVEDSKTNGSYLGYGVLGGATLGPGKHVRKIRGEMKPDGGNEIKDALIAGTAVHKGFILVTEEKELREIVNTKTPGTAISASTMISDLED